MNSHALAPRPLVRTSHQCRPTLRGVSSTLLIPLTARAYGDAAFPAFAVQDAYAAGVLEQLGAPLRAQITHFLRDRPSVFGVLSRTRIFRRLANSFFKQYPQAWGVNLGCGLSCYFQWLDTQSNHWLDADMPEVIALRQGLLPAAGRRQKLIALDLCAPGWWQRLGLPPRDSGQAVLVMCEGVLMYLNASEVEQVLREFGEHAPPGSQMLCDTLSWMAVGTAALHPSVRHTHAQFGWGPRHLREFTAPHPRLVLQSEHCIMDGYDLSTSLACTAFRAMWGVPLYGLMQLGLREPSARPDASKLRLVTG